MVTAKEERNRQIEDLGNSGEARHLRGWRPSRTFALLEADPELVRQFRLRHTVDKTLCADTAPDVRITRIRGFGFGPALLLWTCRTSFDLGMPLRSPTTIANHLTARERIALFCAATDIDHASVGICRARCSSWWFVAWSRDSSTRRYVLTDIGRAVFDVLQRGGNNPAG
jgi:hypothetical protein